jgi:3-isopropylmalate dehydrogenase
MAYQIAVLGGDGIGPEVTAEGLKVLRASAEQSGFDYRTVDYPFGSEHYLKTHELMPESVFDEFRQMNAVLLGAIGDPRVETGLVERAVISGIRFKLDLYINLRPIKLYDARFCPLKDKSPADVDMLVVRENTEDLYTGIGGHFKKGSPDEVAVAEMIFTRKGCERAVRYAFELARKPGRRHKLTLVDKANAVRAMDIWTRTFEEVGREYADVEQDHAYIDAACMWMVKNPEWFDVVVVNNMFGDILTDLGAMVQGGMGIAASGNIHPGQVSMFEPIHGSAPKYKGKGVANPIAAIMAVSMMLNSLGEEKAGRSIEDAVARLLQSGKIRSLGADSGHSTSEIGDLVVGQLPRASARC